MGLARRALLRASRSRWLERQLQRRAFARRAVARFMPGEDPGSALRVARFLHERRVASVLTLLGENVTEPDAADVVTRHYLDVLERAARSVRDCQISVKLTQLGLDLGPDAAAARLDTLLVKAAALGNFVWVDMEGSAYTEPTLRVFERARRVHGNVGLCLQAYLRRTADDLERLLPLQPAIRLVKGAYDEPASVALRRKRDVDENFAVLATRLLDARAEGRQGLPALATHDMELVRRAQRDAARRELSRNSFEIQMLYGIGRQHQRELAAEGYRVRVLISYGEAWFPWYMRRLAERPANVWFVLRNLVR